MIHCLVWFHTACEDVIKFFYRLGIASSGVSIEYKLDGVALALRYRKGNLVSMATRGDGKIGDGVLHLKNAIRGVRSTIDYKDDIEVYGEVIIYSNDFECINRERKKY